jgi:hypothetical protein
MIPNHSQLINLMLGADPGFLAGRFAAEFSASPGTEGAGRFPVPRTGPNPRTRTWNL